MEIPSITTKLPSGSQAFVFGSYLSVAQPRDIDILILYDPALHSPKDAYKLHRTFVDYVEQLVGIPVDVTLLTYAEEKSTGFIEDTHATPINKRHIRVI